MKHRYQKVKIAVIILIMMAAGVCYSCGRGQEGWESGDLSVIHSQEEQNTVFDEVQDAPGTGETESGQISGSSKAGSQNADSQNAETEKTPVCYVHICGEVAVPGVYEIEEGSRVFQVVERAGGFTEQAATQYLNMAQTVSDGMKIVVPARDSLSEGEQYGAGSAGILSEGVGSGGNAGDGTRAKVNLNTASKEELMTLKGIGEAKAEDIIAYRESHGGFQRIEDIMKISGIKNAAFEKIKDDITV